MSVVGHGTGAVEEAREDLASLRRRVVSELVDLNLRLPKRRLSRRERMMRAIRKHTQPRRSRLRRLVGR